MVKRPLHMLRFINVDHPRWPEWLEICSYTRWNPDGPLKPVLYRGFVKPYNPTLGVNQEFYNMLVKRIKKKKPIRMAVVGNAGEGKTYLTLHLAQLLERGKFKVDQIVFSGEDFIRLQNTLKDGQVIVLEEPTYSASARGWQSTWQQCLVRTVESSRFQNNPLLVPVVNRGLLDKIIREHYIQYVVQMFDRGIGRAYEYKQSQWKQEGKRYGLSDLAVYEPGVDLARCGRETCLGCMELKTCNKYIWPQYERKRDEWIRYYQKRDREMMEEHQDKRTAGDRFIELCDEAYDAWSDLTDEKGKLDSAIVQYRFKVDRIMAQQIIRVLNKRGPLVTN